MAFSGPVARASNVSVLLEKGCTRAEAVPRGL